MAQILVIEGDTDVAALVELKLARDGHLVHVEQSGIRGLAHARANRHDIIIVNRTLPGMNGKQVCSLLREDPSMAGTWLIMLSAWPLPGPCANIPWADEILAMPFSPSTLSARVTAALAR